MTDSITNLLKERGKTHGDFENHARITQQLKRVIHAEINNRIKQKRPSHLSSVLVERDTTPDVGLSDTQRESLAMIVHKIGRIIAGDPSFADHWDDIAGYPKLCGSKK